MFLTAIVAFSTTAVYAAEVKLQKVNKLRQYSQEAPQSNEDDSEENGTQTQVYEYVYPESSTEEVIYTPEYYEPYDTGIYYYDGGDYGHHNGHHEHHGDHHNRNHSGHHEGHHEGHHSGGHHH